MRNRTWNLLADIKFKALYTHECYQKSDRYFRFISLFVALTSASSIASWAIWSNISTSWATLIAISQVFVVGMPFFPFIKNDKSFLEMSYEFESLYLKTEKLWYSLEKESANQKKLEKQFFKIKEQALQIEKSHRGVSCPEFKHWLQKINIATDKALTNNFHNGE